MTTFEDLVPGGRAGEVEQARRLSADLAGRGVHGVVPSWIDTVGVNRIKTVPLARLASTVAWAASTCTPAVPAGTG